MKTPTVWVVKEQMMRGDLGSVAMDYSPAMKFGDLEFITHCDMPLHEKSTIQKVWDADVARFVSKYDPTTDFIIATGQPMAIMTVGWLLGVVGKNPRFLVWRHQENLYRAVNYDGSVLPALV